MSAQNVSIPVGSGYLYAMAFSGSIPADSAIETEDNRLGYIQSGATITYKPTYKEITHEGRMRALVLTDEEVTLKPGLIAWRPESLGSILETAEIDETDGKTTVKIGGYRGSPFASYLFRFVHPDAEQGDVRITIAGKNGDNFSFTYKPDDTAMLSPEIRALPMDDDGTLLIFEESSPSTT